uniref:Polysaccharide export protein n=1 Tax=Solibacter usitatus (strain Ellin6076) TaxID=234267 RepID=Q01XL8_SOLUE
MKITMKIPSLMLIGVAVHVSALVAQVPPAQPGGQPRQQLPASQQSVNVASAPMERLRPNYVLRPGDQILIRAFEMEEISERPFRIDGDGYVNLPVLGRVKCGGITVEKFESTLLDALRKYVRQPQVTVTVVQFSSEPVFFVGAFKAPGIYPLEGRRTMVEMMASIGGLQPTASRRIKLTRRKEFGEIPLASAVPTPDGSASTLEINMASLRDNVNPAEDLVLQPFDVISVERAEMVYVTGEVNKVGAFELQERDSISVIQALTLAGGLNPNANTKTARILRPVMNTSRRAEIQLNLQSILEGHESDQPLLPNDVLYIPKGTGLKHNLGKTMLVVLPVAGTIASLAIAFTR